MSLTQQWWYVNLTRNSFYILFPAQGIMSYRKIISNRLCIHFAGRTKRPRGSYAAGGRVFETPVLDLAK